MITHYDLFAGIGGFSLALEEVFHEENIKNIFCEWEQFPTAVLKQHWPDGEYWGDITELVAHTNSARMENGRHLENKAGESGSSHGITIITGGFPCQPFSHAGRRKGTADDRYQWPNMFEIIRNVKPDWVIAENVRGLVTWNDGMVLEQVCTDMESEGYEVQPLIIPAVAVNTPHRRDRVWIIANRNSGRQRLSGAQEIDATETRQPTLDGAAGRHRATGNTQHDGLNGSQNGQSNIEGGDGNAPGKEKAEQSSRSGISRGGHAYPDWNRSWQKVATATCNDTMDDGLSRIVDGVPYTRSKWRKDSLKAYGNAIVPQVAMQIFSAIKRCEYGEQI